MTEFVLPRAFLERMRKLLSVQEDPERDFSKREDPERDSSRREDPERGFSKRNDPERDTSRREDPERDYEAFLSSYGQERHFSLRVNPLKCGREQFLALAREMQEAADTKASVTFHALETLRSAENSEKAQNAEAAQVPEIVSAGETAQAAPLFLPVPWEPDGFYYDAERIRPGRLPWHEAGMYYIQEASAMVPAMLCGARPGERILDLCAAPGGKSTKLAADLRGEGILVANEIHPERAKVLSSNLERMGVRNAVVTNETPQRLASRFPLFFDRIVVDAPCSGEGMFRKEEEALLHWSLENVRMCAERQLEILEEAAGMLRAGGTLVYSTCTFSPEENEGVIGRFLTGHPEFSVVNIPELLGGRMEEWGFSRGFGFFAPEAGPQACREPEEDGFSRGFKTGAAEEGIEIPESIARSLRETIRLWPHRVEGEGHFAAVLRKAGREPESAAPGPDGKTDGKCRRERRTAAPDDLKQDGGRKDGGYSVDQRASGRRAKKRGSGSASDRGSAGQTSGRRNPGPAQKRGELLRLWADFCRETLREERYQSLNPRLIREENLIVFGDALYALPVPAGTFSMDGLRVLRPGLHLGTLVRGRFEPAHALAMALRGEEVLRSVRIRGQSPEAYAWLRGEALAADLQTGKGWTLVLIDGCSAGWGKTGGNGVKNHYPKGLRRGNWFYESPALLVHARSRG